MGYMILPRTLLSRYNEVFKDFNGTVPILNQYVVAHLIETGEYDRHVRRMNHVFRQRLECFEREFKNISSNLKLSSNGSGQYFLLEFSTAVSQDILIKKAAEQGVKVYSTMQFWQEKTDCPPNTLFLGFSKIDINEEVPIELLEKFIQKAFKKYNLRANFINIDFEQTNMYRISFFTENNKLYYNIYGCCIYELYSKICIKIYSEVKNNKLIEYI